MIVGLGKVAHFGNEMHQGKNGPGIYTPNSKSMTMELLLEIERSSKLHVS